jgi:hypothetical protein
VLSLPGCWVSSSASSSGDASVHFAVNSVSARLFLVGVVSNVSSKVFSSIAHYDTCPVALGLHNTVSSGYLVTTLIGCAWK